MFCINTFVYDFSAKENNTRKCQILIFPVGGVIHLQLTIFFLINILKICHNIRKCSKTKSILNLTDLYPHLVLWSVLRPGISGYPRTGPGTARKYMSVLELDPELPKYLRQF